MTQEQKTDEYAAFRHLYARRELIWTACWTTSLATLLAVTFTFGAVLAPGSLGLSFGFLAGFSWCGVIVAMVWAASKAGI